MRRDDAAARLPGTYRRVLALLDEGCSDDEIAVLIGIEAPAVRPLVGLARAKLARIRQETRGAGDVR